MEITKKQLLAAFLVVALSVSGAGAKEYPAKEADDDAIPELDCVIEPSEIVDVGSAVPGVVESILADRGDLVKKGAVLAELESSVEQATLDLAKARAQLNAAIELRQENAAFGYLTQKRNQSLLQKSAISMQDMDQLKTETRIAELQVRQEKDNKRIAGLEYRRARSVLQRRTIRSPVDGVVMDRFKSVGEYVEDEPALRVAQLDPLHVEVIVPVDYMGRVTRGMQAQVTTVAPGADTHLATVERVDLVADAASGTYGVRLSLSNPKYEISAGLRCRLVFLPPEGKDSANMAGKMNTTATVEKGNGTEPGESLGSSRQPDPTASVAASEAPVRASTDQPGASYTLGPFADEALARQLSERLEDSSDALVLRKESVHVHKDYLVLAAPQPDRSATRRLVARLDKADITDRFLIARGINKGRVSLGVY
ncbi:MAG: efflux RND transporter periplasmic adaptor subunit, partial [Gammaproteobacteria bacterium]|nr:efflux RND transporter periplasmic adaptor subunit [Gammaproteobacteria bacterium]